MEKINEATTRKLWIDKKLIQAGWTKIIPYKENLDTSVLHNTAVTEYPTTEGPADYLLFLHGQPVGVVEAKKKSGTSKCIR